MKGRSLTLLIILLLAADQLLKIWVKTHMTLGETIIVCPEWFRLHFVENPGAAFGMRLQTGGGVDWGKLLLTAFRAALIVLLILFMRRLLKRGGTPRSALIALALVLAGAIGNVIDSAFYGWIFSASTPVDVAHFGGHYAPPMLGRVVDMFYFPLFRWPGGPRFLLDGNGYFFGAIFNLADAYISVAAIWLLLFERKFLGSLEKKSAK